MNNQLTTNELSNLMKLVTERTIFLTRVQSPAADYYMTLSNKLQSMLREASTETKPTVKPKSK